MRSTISYPQLSLMVASRTGNPVRIDGDWCNPVASARVPYEGQNAAQNTASIDLHQPFEGTYVEQLDYLVVTSAFSGRRYADDTDAECGKFCKSRRSHAAGPGTEQRASVSRSRGVVTTNSTIYI